MESSSCRNVTHPSGHNQPQMTTWQLLPAPRQETHQSHLAAPCNYSPPATLVTSQHTAVVNTACTTHHDLFGGWKGGMACHRDAVRLSHTSAPHTLKLLLQQQHRRKLLLLPSCCRIKLCDIRPTAREANSPRASHKHTAPPHTTVPGHTECRPTPTASIDGQAAPAAP